MAGRNACGFSILAVDAHDGFPVPHEAARPLDQVFIQSQVLRLPWQAASGRTWESGNGVRWESPGDLAAAPRLLYYKVWATVTPSRLLRSTELCTRIALGGICHRPRSARRPAWLVLSRPSCQGS